MPFDSGRPQRSLHNRTSDRGNPVLENLRVFRVGTFRDSMGIENTWESLHLDQMIFHFDYLVGSDVFPNVPLRVDHSMSMNGVIGYIERLYRDPSNPDFLSVDLEFTEPEAWDRWQRGTYRSRSLEVGMYETNEGATFYPVVFGLAFVDIPAVEGLYSSGNPARHHFRQVIQDQEDPPMDIAAALYAAALEAWQSAYDRGDWTEAARLAAEFGEHGQILGAYTVARYESACNYAKGLEEQGNPPTDPPTDPLTGQPTPPTQEHSRPAPTFNFRVGGQTTTDFAAVQAHIDNLEADAARHVTEGRNRYIDELAQHGKIGQPQVDTMKALAATMTPEQFEAFKSSYDAAPALSLLSAHGGATNPADGAPTPPAPGAPSSDETFNLLVETVQNHGRAGMKPEDIKASASYKKLESACTSRGVQITDYVNV